MLGDNKYNGISVFQVFDGLDDLNPAHCLPRWG